MSIRRILTDLSLAFKTQKLYRLQYRRAYILFISLKHYAKELILHGRTRLFEMRAITSFEHVVLLIHARDGTSLRTVRMWLVWRCLRM